MLPFLLAQSSPCILDLGTGSGAIILTLLAEAPQATGIGTDISDDALATAHENARNLGVEARLALRRSDWFEQVGEMFDLIVSNPPYIARGKISRLSPEVGIWDPLAALDGGEDGLDAYRSIAAGAPQHLLEQGLVAVEIGSGRSKAVQNLFSEQGLRPVAVRSDLAGIARCLVFQREKMGVGNRPDLRYIASR